MALDQTPELNEILKRAVDMHASEVFLFPFEPLSFRVKGEIIRSSESPLESEQIREIASAAFGEQEISKLGREVGALIAPIFLSGVVDARLILAKSLGEYTITINLLPFNIPDVKEIQVPSSVLKAALSDSGLIIIAGSPGSGKTTTLMSLAEYISNMKPCHICTIEDPIHYIIKPKKAVVQQREVGPDIPDMISGIIAAQRQYPDIIIVTEIRDCETLQACIDAARIGQLVILQFTASTIPNVISDMADLYPREKRTVLLKQLSEVIRAVTIQKLFMKTDGSGRVAAYGVLIPNIERQRVIAESGNLADKISSVYAGCQSIEEDIDRLVSEGIIPKQD
jgi:twitching motility protein PilT